MQDIRGTTAIVTGGSKGIGYAIADSLAAAGVRVFIGARTASEVEQAAAEITARHGTEVTGVRCDVRSLDDCRDLVARAAADGNLAVLVNNAGVGRFAPVADMSADDWHAVIETNLNSLFYCTNAALPHLRASGTSWVINIGSLAGKNPFVNGAAYNASKFALVGFSEALMQEVRKDGVRVSYIMPGSVATDFSHPSGSGGDESWKIQPEDIAQIVMDLLRTPQRTLPSRVEVRPSQPK